MNTLSQLTLKAIIAHLIPVIFFFLLTGCASTTTTENITENTLKSIEEVNKTIKVLEDKIDEQCKTDFVIASIDSVKSQVSAISGQVSSLNMACVSEKQVLERDITIREGVIGFLFLLLLGVVYLFIRKR